MHRPSSDPGSSLVSASTGWACFACLAALVPTLLGAEPATRPRLRAVPLSTAPELDGEVLQDPAWSALEAVDGFWQVRPYDGQPASERTEVRVGFTPEALFIGVVCFDGDTGGIIISDSRRDASLQDTDSFQLILDTFRDEQNGFVFGTNPAGIEYDGQVVNEGSGGGGGGGGRFRRGSGGGFNVNWDGVWDVRTKIGSYGWSAEFRIPFRTLRYPASAEAQTWGLNFQRNIRRHNETAFWARLARQHNLYRLSDAGALEEIRPPRQRNLKLNPYVLVQRSRSSSGGGSTDGDGEAGLDLKYSLTPSLTLDGTLNTDFAQVEVDEQQVNLDRFNLFFPEKRPFFLENAGLFSVGSPGVVELFFSRRIGLSDGGAEVPVLGGARLSGKVSRRTHLGFLAMQTDEIEEDGLAAASYRLARVSHELPNRSSFGALLIGREDSGSLARAERENRTFALDGQLGVGENTTFTAFAARTDTPGLEGRDHAFQLGGRYSAPKWRWGLSYLEVGEDFNPEVGFLQRSGFRRPSFNVFRTIRPDRLWGFHELRPHIFYQGFWDFDGFQESGFLHVDNHWEWRNGYEIHTGINFTVEGIRVPFEIAPEVTVEPGSYEHEELQLVVRTNSGAPIHFRTTATIGGFFGGDRVSFDSTLSLRRGEALTSEISWSHNNVNLPVGDFDINLGRLRLSYSLTNDLLLQALVQYNDRNDDISTNLRFSWLRKANSGLFVVYNELREFGSTALPEPERSVIVKYSHLIDVLN